MCDQWDSQDYRRTATPKISIEAAQAHFEKQAAELSDCSRHIRAFVLNAV
jgi:hypothetical protein